MIEDVYKEVVAKILAIKTISFVQFWKNIISESSLEFIALLQFENWNIKNLPDHCFK
jgi:hypothetical protein